MTFTTHGHHIPGTTHLGVSVPSEQVAYCGGPDTCESCAAEAMRALRDGDNPIVPKEFNPYSVHIADMIEELIQQIVGAYKGSRERTLAITNIEQGGLWLSKCTTAEQVRNIDQPYLEAVATSKGQ